MYVFPALQKYYEMVRKHWDIFKSCEIKGLQNNNPHQKLIWAFIEIYQTDQP